MAYNEVVDPSILRRLETESGSGSNQDQSAISFDNTSSNVENDTGFKEVTDPNVLNRLESQQSPSRMRSFLAGIKGGAMLPMLQTGMNLRKGTDFLAQGAGQSEQPYLQKLMGSNDNLQQKIDYFSNTPEMQRAAQQHPNYVQAGKLTGEAGPMLALSMFPEFRGATMRNRMAGNAAMGGLTSSDPAMGALLGAVAEPASHIIGKASSLLWNTLTGSPLQALAKDFWNVTIGKLRGVDNSTIAKEEKQLHDTALGNAEKVSLNPKYKWDNSAYKDELQQKIDEINTKFLPTAPESPEWNGAVKLLQHWKDTAPDDIAGMVYHNKALNQLYDGQIVPGVRMPKWLPSFAISKLKPVIKKNLSDNGLSDTLGKDINTANEYTQDRVKKNIFEDARDEHELLNRFNSLDKHTRENLYYDDEINKIKQFENALRGDKRIDKSLPPHAGLEAHTLEFSKDILKRLLPNMAVPEFAEPGNR